MHLRAGAELGEHAAQVSFRFAGAVASGRIEPADAALDRVLHDGKLSIAAVAHHQRRDRARAESDGRYLDPRFAERSTPQLR